MSVTIFSAEFVACASQLVVHVELVLNELHSFGIFCSALVDVFADHCSEDKGA